MSGHIAVVTGGSRGIGRAVVERLYADGARVATCGRGGRPAYLPDDAVWIRADVASPYDADRLVAQATENLGPSRSWSTTRVSWSRRPSRSRPTTTGICRWE